MGLLFTVSSVNQVLSAAVMVRPIACRITIPGCKSSKQWALMPAPSCLILRGPPVLLENHARHPEIGGVNHLAVERRRSAAQAGGILVGSDEPLGVRHLRGCRREHLVGDGKLR